MRRILALPLMAMLLGSLASPVVSAPPGGRDDRDPDGRRFGSAREGRTIPQGSRERGKSGHVAENRGQDPALTPDRPSRERVRKPTDRPEQARKQAEDPPRQTSPRSGWESRPNPVGREISRKHDKGVVPAGEERRAAPAQRPVRPEPARMSESQVLRTPRRESNAPAPQWGPGGRPFKADVAHRPPPHATRMFADPRLQETVRRCEIRERVPGRYSWHRHDGHDFCHYYDRAGRHWYGWVVGVNFHWSRWHAGYWWWYDTRHDRWCYWHSGHWWWPSPGRTRVVYVYLNDRYVPASEAPAVAPAAPEEPAQAAAPVPEDRYFRNPAMDRMVGVFGANRDAFLYDASEKQAFRPVFLASGVKDVRMSDDSTGRPLQILVEKEDGTFEVFDAQGRPYVPSAPPRG